MVPLVGNICTIGTNLITNGTIGKEIYANGKNGNAIGTNQPMVPLGEPRTHALFCFDSSHLDGWLPCRGGGGGGEANHFAFHEWCLHFRFVCLGWDFVLQWEENFACLHLDLLKITEVAVI